MQKTEAVESEIAPAFPACRGNFLDKPPVAPGDTDVVADLF